MAAPEDDGQNWLFYLGLIQSISVPGGDLASLEPDFQWPVDNFSTPPALSVGFDESSGASSGIKECGSRKRVRSGSCSAPETKAHREKIRRDKLNDRFQELSSILEPGRPPKMDKSVILSDAVCMVMQLREEAQKLKDSYGTLQEKVHELKAEKTELRDEKQKLKEEKHKLEMQLKALTSRPNFPPQSPGMPIPFAQPPQGFGGKMVPYVGYPGIPLWQFVPPAVVDTSEDHVLRPPVA